MPPRRPAPVPRRAIQRCRLPPALQAPASVGFQHVTLLLHGRHDGRCNAINPVLSPPCGCKWPRPVNTDRRLLERIGRLSLPSGAETLKQDETSQRNGASVTNGYDYIIVGAGSPAACSPTGSPRITARPCCCSKPGRRTGIPIFRSRLAWDGCTTRRCSIGATRPSPSPTSTTAGSRRCAARCLAVRRRSTSWPIRAATAATTIAGRRRARGLVLCRRVALLQSRGDLGKRRGHLARRRGAARHAIRQDARSDLRRLARGREAVRLSLHRGLQRQAAGRFRPRPIHHPRRAALVDGARLSAAAEGRHNLTVETGARRRGS